MNVVHEQLILGFHAETCDWRDLLRVVGRCGGIGQIGAVEPTTWIAVGQRVWPPVRPSVWPSRAGAAAKVIGDARALGLVISG